MKLFASEENPIWIKWRHQIRYEKNVKPFNILNLEEVESIHTFDPRTKVEVGQRRMGQNGITHTVLKGPFLLKSSARGYLCSVDRTVLFTYEDLVPENDLYEMPLI